MKYTIKPEYVDLWGDEAYAYPVITEDELDTISRGWEKPIDELLPQLDVYNFDSAVDLMDDEIREAVHADLAPCSDIEFMREYEKRHLEKYGKEFEY